MNIYSEQLMGIEGYDFDVASKYRLVCRRLKTVVAMMM